MIRCLKESCGFLKIWSVFFACQIYTVGWKIICFIQVDLVCYTRIVYPDIRLLVT
jgi:hypothetical protein